MKAVILAAGVSRRLYPVTYEIPKCLITVGHQTIIDRQINAIKSVEFLRILIILFECVLKVINFLGIKL